MLLKKKKNKLILRTIVFAVVFFSFFNSAFAQTPENPDEGNLVVVFNPDPLFDGDSFLPGNSQLGEVTITNNTEDIKQISAEIINFPTSGVLNKIPDDDLSRALEVVIREKNGVDLYGGGSLTDEKMLFDLYKDGQINLSSIPSGETKIFEIEISFPEDKQNEWQEKTTRFDVIVGFQGEEGEIIISSETQTNSGSRGSLPQGLIIKHTDVLDVSATSATISWFTSYNSTSQVVFCRQSDNCNLNLNDNLGNPPLYGYNLTTAETDTPANQNGVTYHEIILTGLEPETTYEYRSISHASPPTISRNYEFTTLEKGALEDKIQIDDKQSLTETPTNNIVSNYIQTIKEIFSPNNSAEESESQIATQTKINQISENNDITNERKSVEIFERESKENQLEDNEVTNIVLNNSFSYSYFWILLLMFIIITASVIYISRYKK